MSFITNSSLAFHNRSLAQMSETRRDVETMQSQLASGQRLSRSSDDPVAAAQARMLERAQRLAEMDGKNAVRANDDLSLAGSALQSIGEDLARIKELAVWAGNDTVSDEQRASIGQEIAQVRLGLLAAINARDVGGSSLFAGEVAGDAYAMDGNGDATYLGTAQSSVLLLGEGQSVQRGLTGPEVFDFTSAGQPQNLLAFVKTLADALQGSAADPGVAARDALSGLDDALDVITRSQAIIGARIAWVDTIQGRQEVRSEARAAAQQETSGVDYTSTIARLQQALTVLEASQAGFARLSSLTLFDRI